MGAILEFTSRSRSGERMSPPRRQDGDGAEIVLFPGIRVEYHTIDLSHRVRDTGKLHNQSDQNRSAE